ncbi:MAG: transglycosylase domain-containing protein [Pseudohongiellaceae bacterium]
MLGAAALAGITMVAMAAYLYLAPLLPAAETYRDVRLETPLRIYTADNRLIDEIGNRRNPVSFDEVPPLLTDALIATEDVRFYSSRRGQSSRLYGFITGNALVASTLPCSWPTPSSQHNVYLRKFKEIPFACKFSELTKEEILTLYLNTSSGAMYWCRGLCVLRQEVRTDLAEAAMIISLLPLSSTCNPGESGARHRRQRRASARWNMITAPNTRPMPAGHRERRTAH